MDTTKPKIYVKVKDGIGYIVNTDNCILLQEIKDNGYWNATVYGGATYQPHYFLSSTKHEITPSAAMAIKAKIKLIQAIVRYPFQPEGVEWFKPDNSIVSIPLGNGMNTHGKIEANLIGKYTQFGNNRLYLTTREAVDIASQSYQ